MFVTIDWDFFFKYNKIWDFGHNSSAVFTGILWLQRDATYKANTGQWLRDIYKPDQKLIDQINTMLMFSLYEKTMLSVVQDHRNALRYIPKDETVVVNFDAHWDVQYNSPLDPKKEPIDENWLGHWLLEDKKRKAIIVYSPYSMEDVSVESDVEARIQDQIEIWSWADWKEEGGLLKADHINYCASPGWCPPWGDIDFINLCNRFGEICDPKSIREYDLKAVEKMAEFFKQCNKHFKENYD
jgi:hypothetical protein